MSEQRSLPPQDDFARALLRSAEGDEPSNAAYAKVAAALGVSGVVGASLPAPAVLIAGSSGLGRWASSLGGKLALFGVSGALLLGAGGVLLRHRLVVAPATPASTGASVAPLVATAAVAPTVGTEPGAKNDSTPAAASSAVTPGAADPLSEQAAAQVINLDDPAAQAELRPAHAATRAFAGAGAARTSGSSSSSLPEQVQSLDRARVALSSGNAGAALVEIAYYRKAWPKGVFLTEASVLEIEALAKRGERSLAAARAQAFVAAHPDSPQAERLRALIPARPVEQP